MKVAFQTLGCKVNQYETNALAEKLRNSGHEIVSADGFADIYVVNTCTVTSMADRKSRQQIRRAKKLNPDGFVVVTGCYSELNPEEALNMTGADLVIENRNKLNLPEYIKGLPVKAAGSAQGVTEIEQRTRAFIKIQDGCDRYCSYCIVPYARKELQSTPKSDIITEGENLIKSGYKEIVLTGINTALYKPADGAGLEEVVGGLDGLPGDFRIRLSSLEPTVIDADYVKRLLKYDRLCRHIHLSLQSGSDKILKLMNRRYDTRDYMKIVKVLLEFDAGYGISTDIITGFPGETEEDFKESLKLVERVDFCKVHVFKFSARKGTAAAGMKEHVTGNEKKSRSELLIKAGESSARRFFESNIGRKERVLVEEYLEKQGVYTGYAGNYIKVYIDKKYSDSISLNAFTEVKLTGLYEDGMKGEP